MRKFETGATRDVDVNKIPFKAFLSPFAMEQFGLYMNRHREQADGSMRAPDNWKLGIPIPVYEDSLLRHAHEFHKQIEMGDVNAAMEAACAIMFNVQGWMHEHCKPVAFGDLLNEEDMQITADDKSEVDDGIDPTSIKNEPDPGAIARAIAGITGAVKRDA